MALDAVNQGQVIDGSSAIVASAKAVGDATIANITTQSKTFDYNAPKPEETKKESAKKDVSTLLSEGGDPAQFAGRADLPDRRMKTPEEGITFLNYNPLKSQDYLLNLLNKDTSLFAPFIKPLAQKDRDDKKTTSLYTMSEEQIGEYPPSSLDYA